MRAHVILPTELVEQIDRVVSPRRRSQFFVDAVREKLQRIQLGVAASAAAGSLQANDIPGWESAEAAAEWVHAQRQADDRPLDGIADE